MKEQITSVPTIYSEAPSGEGVIVGVANGMLQLQNKSTNASTFIGAGFIKLMRVDDKGTQEIVLSVSDNAKLTINGKEV